MLKVSAVGGLIEELASAVNLTELAQGSTVWLAVTGSEPRREDGVHHQPDSQPPQRRA